MQAVIYSDGSAIPNPGYAGWGNYGYTYTEAKRCAKPKDTKGLRVNEEIVEMENEHFGNPEILDSWTSWGGLIDDRSNNAAEIAGAAEALTYASTLKINSVEVRTDSRHVIEGAEKWLENWARNDFKKRDGETVKNVDCWKALHEAIKTLKNGGIKHSFRWVKGHAGNPGNEAADLAADKGRILANNADYETKFEQLTKVEETKDNKKKTVKVKKPKTPLPSKLFMHSRWYFNTNVETQQTKSGLYLYTCGVHLTDELWGKEVSDVSYSIVALKEKDKVLEDIKRRQTEISGEYIQPTLARLDNIKSATRYPDLYLDGATYLTTRFGSKDLMTLGKSAGDEDDKQSNGIEITKLANPPRLAFIGMETLEYYARRLEQYLEGSDKVTYTDVTDHFYDTEVDKKGKSVMKPAKIFQENAKSVTAEVNWKIDDEQGVKSVVLAVGMDAPTRNVLSAIAKTEPSIGVITWPESKRTIRHAVVVRAGDEYALYTSGYSNLSLVK